jgi:hypothetical protein
MSASSPRNSRICGRLEGDYGVWLRKLSQSSRSGGSLSVASITAPRPLEIETAGDVLPRKLDYVPGMTPSLQDFTPLPMSSTSFWGVTGVCAMRTPKGCNASSMAEITAAAVGMVLTSPAPLAPSGLSGDGVSL